MPAGRDFVISGACHDTAARRIVRLEEVLDVIMPETGESREVLAGLVERVTFHNEENGVCVLRVKARGHKDLVTIIGHAASMIGSSACSGGNGASR